MDTDDNQLCEFRHPERVFLGWERPAVESVADELLRMEAEDADAFRRARVVVPTAESGRRLRLELARRAGRAVMLPRICLSGQLIPTEGAAGPEAVMAAWVQVLAAEEERPDLFPVRPLANREQWAVEMAGQMMRLRARLEEADVTPQMVIRRLAGLSEEAAEREVPRWQALERLFAEADAVLEQEWQQVSAPKVRARALQRGTRCGGVVVLACVPYVAAQTRRYLRGCDAVRVLVNAPDSHAELFDDFGQPLPVWEQAPLPVPDECIHSAATDAAFAETTLRLLQQDADVGNVVLGACDSRFLACLRSRISAAGWGVHLPQGRAFGASAEGLLPRQLLRACENPEVAAPLLALLRSPAVLRAFPQVEPYAATCLLDQVEQVYYPAGVPRLMEALRREPGGAALLRCAEQVHDLVCRTAEDFAAGAEAWAALLAPTAHRALVKALQEVAETAREHTPLATHRVALPMLEALTANVVLPETQRENCPLDALGWVELGYAKGSHLVLAGFHEGCVPETVTADAFLPDSLKRELGMENSCVRAARDAFLLTALLQRKGLRTDIVLARQLADGTPVAASRLLLHVEEGADGSRLARRVQRLFGDMEAPEGAMLQRRGLWYIGAGGAAGSDPAHESIAIIAGNRPNPWAEGQKPISPSAINSFLQAPLEFWCRQLFGINAGDAYKDNKAAMELNEYGTLLHDVLRRTVEQVRDEEVRGVPAIRELCEQHLETVYAERFGGEVTLPLLTQKRIMLTKLRQFAADYAADVEEGWRTLYCELPVGNACGQSWSLDGEVPFRLVIDRVDRHMDGRLRVVDYKTNSRTPAEVHLEALRQEPRLQRFRALMPDFPLIQMAVGGRPAFRAWVNVQLPLYAACVKALLGAEQYPEMAYYNLPKNRDRAHMEPFVLEVPEVENALDWVRVAVGLIRRGECLVSAQALGRKSYQEFGALLTVQDTRSLFNLPPLVPPPCPEPAPELLYSYDFKQADNLLHDHD